MKVRIDRMVSLGLARVKRLHRVKPVSGRFPILMYHGINDTLARRHPYFETNTSPAVFRRHMQMLVESGYRSVDLDEAICDPHCQSGSDRNVVITFDDGYADFYDEALPVLIEYGLSAIMYIVTDNTKGERLTKNGKQYMSWAEVLTLPKHGIRVGSHTASHGKLYEMSAIEVDNEVRRSKEILEDKLSAPVESFAYPYAFPEHDRPFVNHLQNCLRNNGYKNGVSTILGMATGGSDRYILPRLPVSSFDDDQFLRTKLEGGYDWLHTLQYAKKICARRFA